MKFRWTCHFAALFTALGSLGCSLVAGIDGPFSTDPEASKGSSSSSGSGSGGGNNSSNGSGGFMGSSSGGGIMGAGGAVGCQAGMVEDCYSGPNGTEGVGTCVHGSRTCLMGGSGWGPCEGEVIPAIETCLTPEDEDCDGSANEEGEGCICIPNQKKTCYTGPSDTEGVGLCVSGEESCNADGLGFGPCLSQVLPSPELCNTLDDEDCDGLSPDTNSGCECEPGNVAGCYTGPMGTNQVGLCHGGQKTCAATGLAYGPCIGEVTPAPEQCDTVEDEDCDGVTPDTSDGCVCLPGQTQNCYTGPPGTQNVGVCQGGQQTCNPFGTAFGACEGEVTPAAEICSTGSTDEDCDGMTLDPDDGCVCAPGTTTACYTGPANTQNVGVCKDGTHTCNAQGTGYGPCMGEILPTADNCATAMIDEDCNGTLNTCTGAKYWTKSFGDAGAQNGVAIDLDPSGNPVITGDFSGTVNFGGATTLTSGAGPDVYVVTLDKTSGSNLFQKHAGAAGDELGLSIALSAAGDVAIAGQFSSQFDFGCGISSTVSSFDAFGVKLDASGACVWSKGFGGTGNQIGNDIVADPSGSVFIVGNFGNNIDFGNGTKNAVGVDAYLVKFSPSGSYLWDKTFGTTLDQFGTSVAVDSAGEVLIAGYFFNSITLGMTTHTSLGGSDIYVAKFTSDGTYLWSQRFGGASDDQAKALALGQNNEIMFIGTTKGSIDFGNGIQTANMGVADVLVAKLNAGGMPIWAKTFGSAGNSQIGNGIDVDGSGHVVITGGFTGTIDFGGGILTSGGGNDIFVAKLDNAGAQIWSKRFGDANANQVGNGVVVTASGAPFVVGKYDGALNIDGTLITSAGGGDIFVLSLQP